VGVPSPLGVRSREGCAPSPDFFFNFYIKIVSFRVFWVAISYRLANCFTRIGNTPGIEIYWRSFQHFGNKAYNYTLRKIARQEMTKMHQKLPKEIARRLRCFFLVHFRIYSLNFFRVVDWGHGPQ